MRTAGVVVRRLPVCGVVNAGKETVLLLMGAELDRVRAGVWARFCGARSAHLSKRQVRDRLMAEQAPAGFGVPQRLWRATVEDTVDKARAWQQAVIATEVRPKIYARAGGDKPKRKRLLGLARNGRWREDPWLARQCRDAFVGKRPRPRRSGRIVADNCSYDVQRDERGRVWLAVMTPTRGARLRLNLGMLPDELVPTRAAAAVETGDATAARAARAKAARIERHNLGHAKLTRQRARDRAVTKDTVYQAVHDLVDTTAHIVAEELSGLRGKSKFGRTASRVYAAWQRSFLADALASVPSRRGSAVTLINPAYTSQQVHSCGHLGIRRGKKVHCQTAGCPQQGIVYDTEINAARNILARATDPQISRYTPTHEVKRILVERAGTVENCPTTTQATTTAVAVSEIAYFPSKQQRQRNR